MNFMCLVLVVFISDIVSFAAVYQYSGAKSAKKWLFLNIREENVISKGKRHHNVI